MNASTVAGTTVFVEHITHIDWNVPQGITGRLMDRIELDAHGRYEVMVIAPEARQALRDALSHKCVTVPPLLTEQDNGRTTDH